MSTPDPSHHQPVESERLLAELRERWMAQYGPRVAAELEPDRRYSLVRVGSAEYAFTEYDRFVRALHHTWDSQLVPEHLQNDRAFLIHVSAEEQLEWFVDPLVPYDRTTSAEVSID